MENFSERYEIIYRKFFEMAEAEEKPSSKLAFSRFFGISQGRMQHWERGQIPRPEDLIAIHEKLGFSYSWLITGQGDPFGEEAGGDVVALKARVAELETELARQVFELGQSDRMVRHLSAQLQAAGFQPVNPNAGRQPAAKDAALAG